MELKHILAATDFSEAAHHAVGRAALLARQHGSALHLFHMVPALSWKMLGRALVEHPLVTEKHLYETARAQLLQLAGECRQDFAVEASCAVDIGRAYEGIAAHAQKIGADLTVLGAQDEAGAHVLFVGSTARKLLYKTGRPVLLVRSKAASPYRSVLAAVDFSAESQGALAAALRLAPDAAVHAMHVIELPFEGKMHYAGIEQNVVEQYRDAASAEAQAQMRDLFDDLGVAMRVQPIVRPGYPSQALLEEARSMHADLLVMGKRGRSALDELFLGSVTEKVLHDIDRDLLLVSA